MNGAICTSGVIATWTKLEVGRLGGEDEPLWGYWNGGLARGEVDSALNSGGPLP